MTAIMVLRVIAAATECLAELLKKATPDQVQGILERHEKRMDRYEKLLDKLGITE